MNLKLQKIISDWRYFIYSKSSTAQKKEVFEQIWIEYHKRLLYFIKGMTAGDSEDLLQEIMMKVYNNLEKFNPLFTFNTWIYTVARNHVLNHLNKKETRINNMSSPLDSAARHALDDEPGDKVMNRELQDIIDQHLKKLQPLHRQIAYLRFYEGMKLNQISKILAVPVGTVKSRLYIIKQSLQKELENYNAY